MLIDGVSSVFDLIEDAERCALQTRANIDSQDFIKAAHFNGVVCKHLATIIDSLSKMMEELEDDEPQTTADACVKAAEYEVPHVDRPELLR